MNTKYKVKIHNVKCIRDLEIEIPVKKGLYAITGMNGCGKSTIAACASTAFFILKMNEYFGAVDNDANIKLEYGSVSKHLFVKQGKWKRKGTGYIGLNGFYEGSLIFGNRFRDTSFDKVKKLIAAPVDELQESDDFVRQNLGLILQGDVNFYEKLYELKDTDHFDGTVFFYEKEGKRVSQFHMSTGENLLISILHSILLRINDRQTKESPCLVLLDEIELALHPSSLRRLLSFLRKISDTYNYAIYFSTHSIELVNEIDPNNIYYIERHADNTIDVINPCYPAFATRNLYDHSGYDKVILVEDDLAQAIINRLLKQEKLLESKLVHVLPTGGYIHVIDFADDLVTNNLLGRKSSISLIIDGDVKREAKAYKNNKGLVSMKMGFLPVPSLEKYLRKTLVYEVDHVLFRYLENYAFQQKSLSVLIGEYKADSGSNDDDKGKLLFRYLSEELQTRRKSRSDLVELVVDYWFDNRFKEFDQIIDFLKSEIQ